MLPVSELRTATTEMLSSAAVVFAGELICEINPDGRTRSVADALGGIGGIVVATELQDALRAHLRAHEILVHYQLRRLATRALGVVVNRAAETSKKPAIRQSAPELREFAPTLTAHWKSIMKDRGWKPDPTAIKLLPLPGFLYRFDTGLIELRTLDIPRWRLALRDTRDEQDADVPDPVLDLLGRKLYRLHPQACAESLSQSPRSFDGLRLRLFEVLIEHLREFLEHGPADRRSGIRDAACTFLTWARMAHARFLKDLDPEARERRADRLVLIQSFLRDCERFIPSVPRTQDALSIDDTDDTIDSVLAPPVAESVVAGVAAEPEHVPAVPLSEDAVAEPLSTEVPAPAPEPASDPETAVESPAPDPAASVNEVTGPVLPEVPEPAEIASLRLEAAAPPEPVTADTPCETDAPATTVTTMETDVAAVTDAVVISHTALEDAEPRSTDDPISDDVSVSVSLSSDSGEPPVVDDPAQRVDASETGPEPTLITASLPLIPELGPEHSESPHDAALETAREDAIVFSEAPPELQTPPDVTEPQGTEPAELSTEPAVEEAIAVPTHESPVTTPEESPVGSDGQEPVPEASDAAIPRRAEIVTNLADISPAAELSVSSWESPVVLADPDAMLETAAEPEPASRSDDLTPDDSHGSAVQPDTTASWESPVVLEDAEVQPESSADSVTPETLDVPASMPTLAPTTTTSWESPVVLEEAEALSHDSAARAEESSRDESAGTHDRSDATGTLDVPAATADESWESPIVLEEEDTGPTEPEAPLNVPEIAEPQTPETAAVTFAPEPSEELLQEPSADDAAAIAASVSEECVSDAAPMRDRTTLSAESPAASVETPEAPTPEGPVTTDPAELRRAAAEAQSRGDFEHAESCLRQLVVDDPADVAAWDSLAQLHLERQQDAMALECLVAIRRLVPALSRERLLAEERMAGVLTRLDRQAEGFACLESACEIAERRHRDDAETAESLSDLSRASIQVARAQILGSDPNRSLTQAVASALPRLVRCLTVRERIASRFGNSPSALRDVAEALVMVADAEFDLGNWHVAFARYSRAVELQRTLIAEHGSSPESLRDLCRLLECAGSIRRFGGDLLGAATSYQSSLEIRLELLRQDRTQPEPLRDVAGVLEKLGDIARSCGNLREATMHFRRALDYRERVLREFGESVEALTELAELEWRMSQTIPEEASVHLERGRAAIQSILDHDWGDPATQAQLSRFERQLTSDASKRA